MVTYLFSIPSSTKTKKKTLSKLDPLLQNVLDPRIFIQSLIGSSHVILHFVYEIIFSAIRTRCFLKIEKQIYNITSVVKVLHN